MRLKLLFLIVQCVLIYSCQKNNQTSGNQNQYMIDLLEKQHAQVNPLEITYYYNQKRAEAYDSARQVPRIQDDQYISYTYWYIRETLNSGNTEKAIQLIEDLDWAEKKIELDPQWNYFFQRLKAISYIRLGEQTNCLLNHTASSCIVPVSGDGIHIDPAGSSKAIDIIEDLLADYPEDLELVWLLNLCYQTIGEYPNSVPDEYLLDPKIFESTGAIPRFDDVAPQL